MTFRLSERATTAITIVVALLLFLHPHLGEIPSRVADCRGREGSERTITLTSSSRRQFLLLRLCDTLVLVNRDSKAFYPAPGPHPSHGSFPELDPKRKLESGEYFPVRLIRVGNYQVHNDATEKILADLTIIGQVK